MVSIAESAERRLVWTWQGFTIRYQQAGADGPPLLLIHGFGAHSDHWRKNIPVLAQACRVYAIDLLGFGWSDKPQPGNPLPYDFETWGQQMLDFCREVVGEPVMMIGNSIGCVVALQAAVNDPQWVKGIAMLNCSLRLMHERHLATSSWLQRWGTPLVQRILAYRPVGSLFFSQIAQPQALRKILRQAYGHPEAVSDELVELLLAPARQPGALEVFLAFIGYSQGPLPEDLLPQVQCPVVILWGTRDPWEPLAGGQALAEYPQVEAFIPLEGLGHCPQDEDPTVVNAKLLEWITLHYVHGDQSLSKPSQYVGQEPAT